ncbi:MAG: glycosyltransferase family 4 protein [Chloroflexaceae bacterium]|nr:glycosyltransferase family 4 protein [Chloroflexaceae bacterium]
MDSLLINLSFLLPQPTGITNYVLNLLPHLSLPATLLAAQDVPGFSRYGVPSNLTPRQGTMGHFRRLVWTQVQIPQIYRNLRASLLFSPIPEAPLSCQCRFVVMVHDLIPLRFPRLGSPLTPYFRHYIPQVLGQAVHILCNSQATAQDLLDFYGIAAAKITPIPLAVERDRFFPRPAPVECPYFLYLGRPDPYKNLGRLIAAFADLPRDYQLWLAGPQDRRYTPKLQAQCSELGIANRVRWLSYVPAADLPGILSNALALVFPSLWEGFGLPVLEAMACGTPVITSNLAALPEVTGDAALLVDPYNTDALADAMKAIATDGTLRSTLGRLGQTRASQFTWAKTGYDTREILQQYM